MKYYGAIEAGGTKFVCAIGTETGEMIDRLTIPTETPEETIDRLIPFFEKHKLESLGVGSFGPISVDKESAEYGYITSTPKLAWKNYPFIPELEKRLGIPVSFTTDVNAAALGEIKKGAAKGLNSCLYITVGTGIGAGAIVGGELVQGVTHPEMGHILIRRHERDSFKGNCPYHGECLEGMAAGPAIEKRWGKQGKDLADVQEVWELEADYLAQGLMQYILILCPEKIIMGGGVMKQQHLFPLIREKLTTYLNGYLDLPDLEQYIVSPGLGDDAGITGALILAQTAK
ncbi:ROK family protein [Bacillus sp. WMMC1349]|uniref:ROK family protein n=1 Tax=Bacillus sp. WMMC1349 TaxID=2736254 RepID=UPI001551F061|nr:ROK family protein [Bacillus sp. WMMC1349]NPC94152.1 ROK family protein [Bacillus sp. WMMC1349]